MSAHRALLPPGWPRPRGYANGMTATGRLVVTGGLIGWDAEERFPGPDLVSQFRQLIENMILVLREGGAGPQHLVRMTWYVVDIQEYRSNLPAIGAHYRAVIGRNFPAMAVMQVGALVEPAARIEIEAMAVIPE